MHTFVLKKLKKKKKKNDSQEDKHSVRIECKQILVIWILVAQNLLFKAPS